MKTTKVILLVALTIFFKRCPAAAQDTRTFQACEGSTGAAECPPGTLINVQRGFYGRDNSNRCLEIDGEESESEVHASQKNDSNPNEIARLLDNEEMSAEGNCVASNALAILRKICQNKNCCSFTARSRLFEDSCPETTNYVRFQYTCVPKQTTLVCERHTGVINCGFGKTIHIIDGFYGRDDTTTCVAAWRPARRSRNTSCGDSSSLQKMKEECDGKQTCTLRASNRVFGNPCRVIFKYIRATYTCNRG